jgi:hypothetical protein
LLSLAAGRISTEQAFVDQISFAIHPRARFGPSWGRVRLLFGVSFPFGIAHFSPRARVEGAREQPLTAAWFAVVGDVGAHLPLGERVFLLSDFYAGTVLAPVRGLVDAESLIELSGPLVGARLGFGLAL